MRRRCYICGSQRQEWRQRGRVMWLECECGLTGVSAATRDEAEENWNMDNRPRASK